MMKDKSFIRVDYIWICGRSIVDDQLRYMDYVEYNTTYLVEKLRMGQSLKGHEAPWSRMAASWGIPR